MYKELWIEFLVSSVLTFVLTVILCLVIIPILRGHKIGQSIRKEGPHWHSGKAGTPTMGGICFILAILAVMLGMAIYYYVSGIQSELIPLALTFMFALSNGLIGFVDDYCKLLRKQNQGLKGYQKLILQFLFGACYLTAMGVFGYMDTLLHIPFTDWYWDMGALYYVLALGMILFVVNSVNLTNGIDGLATTVTFVVFCFFVVVSFALYDSGLMLMSSAIVGGLLGFLLFNAHPAKVFMGDTGSLFLGGAVMGAVLMIGEPLIVLLVGIIYIVEALSVVIQVTSFKLRNKRVFKMSPIHHHFEQCAWSENKIVLVFSAVTLVCSVLAWFGLGL